MARLSRPYQIAIVAVVALFLAWFVLLRSHGSPPGAGSSAPSASSAVGAATQSGGSAGQSAAAQARTAAKPSKVYNGPIPGLHGLSKDVRKAHEAVGVSQRQAASEEAEPASSSTATGSASGATAGGATHSQASADAASGKAVHTGAAAGSGGSSASHGDAAKAKAGSHSSVAGHASGDASRRHGASGTGTHHAGTGSHRSPAEVIASQLSAGRVVLLLFWNPHSSDDAAVHAQVRAVARSMRHKVAVHFAKAKEVGSFGTVTRAVSVTGTPTLLVIAKKGLVTTITGLTDAFAIEQAVREAEH